MTNGLNRQSPILEMKQISKSFPGVKALSEVDFALYPGEVHILAGENGAGKSTLMKCLLGIYQPEEGEICYEGEQVSFSCPKDAIEAGIAAVHQELTMIPYLDAAHNIFLGREPLYAGTQIIKEKQLYQDARSILASLHSELVDLKAPVCTLGVARQQMIEIAKAMAAKPKIMIFDEPTASLTKKEVDFLFEQIRVLKEQGIGIIYISHRMSEFHQIGDRVTVFRDGHLIATHDLKEVDIEEITAFMVGQKWTHTDGSSQHISGEEDRIPSSYPKHKPTEEILKADHIYDRRGKVRDCSLILYPGEIVGIAGLIGSGRTELLNMIFGMERVHQGKIFYKGKDVTALSARKMVKEGVGFLTEDRKGLGLALKAPISWNILGASLSKYFPGGFLSQKIEDQVAKNYVGKLEIATEDVDKLVGQLSGGNQQKVAMAKWLAADTELFLFDEPTRGVDVGAKREIYEIMRKLASEGKTILMVSSEMEEILALSNRVYIMNQGTITRELSAEEMNRTELGHHMLESGERGLETLANDSKLQKTLRAKADVDKNDEQREIQKIPWNEKGIVRNLFKKCPPALYIIVVLMLLFGYRTENFYTFSNLSGILSQAAPLLAVACGQTLIVLIQGTDLSLGAMMGMMTVFWIYCLNLGIPMPAAIPGCLLLGALLGAVNGFIVARAMIPIFIVTLGTQNIFKSVGLLLCHSQTLYFDHFIFRTIGKEKFLGLTWSVWIAFLCIFITMFLLKKTTFGVKVKGLGGNEEALHFSGSNIQKDKIKVFLYAGLMAAIGGMLLCCRIESGNPNSGSGMEFNAIAAVLLGGTSMRQGRGGAGGTIFGVLLIQILKSGLMQTGISSIYQNAIIGVVVLGAIIFDAVLKKREG